MKLGTVTSYIRSGHVSSFTIIQLVLPWLEDFGKFKLNNHRRLGRLPRYMIMIRHQISIKILDLANE